MNGMNTITTNVVIAIMVVIITNITIVVVFLAARPFVQSRIDQRLAIYCSSGCYNLQVLKRSRLLWAVIMSTGATIRIQTSTRTSIRTIIVLLEARSDDVVDENLVVRLEIGAVPEQGILAGNPVHNPRKEDVVFVIGLGLVLRDLVTLAGRLLDGLAVDGNRGGPFPLAAKEGRLVGSTPASGGIGVVVEVEVDVEGFLIALHCDDVVCF
mmetsp:Transcript_25907/g.56783  ORF Transcript_25907/g.56783 Transcript_25907/m.56783 type:complete len:211 (+) Transcript_25907:263-895(+)